MKDASKKGRESRSNVEHKGTVSGTRAQVKGPVAPGKDTSGSVPGSRRTPPRDKKTGKFLPKKKR